MACPADLQLLCWCSGLRRFMKRIIGIVLQGTGCNTSIQPKMGKLSCNNIYWASLAFLGKSLLIWKPLVRACYAKGINLRKKKHAWFLEDLIWCFIRSGNLKILNIHGKDTL